MYTKKILVVCLGNICRSPTAHAVLSHKAKLQRLDIAIDSAGTSASHKGERPDSRSVRVGSARGYNFSGLHSRPVFQQDFADFDLILAATALSQNLILVTNNERHFCRIEGLKIENWSKQ